MASNTDPQNLYTKATRAELAQSYDEAFRLYIRAAEGFLQHSRAQGEPGKSRSKKDAGRALERAERIKSVKGAGGSGSGTLRPVEVDFWSAEEQKQVLSKSSSINGLLVPLWDDPASASEPPTQPGLSPDQIARGATWRVLDPGDDEHIAERIDAEGIVQHVVSDCSVCAAMSVCIALQKRGTAPAVPSRTADGVDPTLPAQIHFRTSGLSQQHDLRVLLNGAWRRVTIDSALPIDPNGTILGLSAHCATTNTPILWPSLVEKAYMKLMGGYDFPGSNSSIDFHALTGWIPEHIEIRSPAFSREKVWARIADVHAAGHCVITLGTDNRVSLSNIRDWALEKWGRELIAEHNYAVVDMKEVGGERLLSILDSRIDRDLLDTTVGENSGSNLRPTFDMPWDDVCAIFEGVYVNWDPALLSNHLQFHGIWKGRCAQANDAAAHRHLRLMVQPSPGAERDLNQDVWVLLTRHQADSSRKAEYIALHVHDEDEDRLDIQSIAEKARFTSSVHTLVRTRVPEATKALSILASYDGPFEDVGFTLSVYTSHAVSWDKTTSRPPFMHKETGALTSTNAGGNCNYPTYMINPQYHLRIHPETTKATAGMGGSQRISKANVILSCEVSRQTPVNITAVWSRGERILELAQKEIAASSGPYGYGFVRADQQLQAGDYTVIVSAFGPEHMGPFTLTAQSSHHFDLQPIPQEGAGVYQKFIRGAWDGQSAAGGPTFKQYLSNPIYEIDLQSSTLLRRQPSHIASLNVTLFQTSPNSEAIGKHLATSGPYSDAISGVITPEVSLSAGKYLLIPSTYQPALQMGFRMTLYCSSASVTYSLRPPRTV
ncbi:cysteine proteinase [Athelia psychrophila]|uniref:Cysteine proteinase n=1 Tax=Athelia psychrophila TaxID=1759441 RepID=A0A166CKS8_9AGAM|nr:cysteine proteinase [Fibularhizoctonia sp. CBS 109695]